MGGREERCSKCGWREEKEMEKDERTRIKKIKKNTEIIKKEYLNEVLLKIELLIFGVF